MEKEYVCNNVHDTRKHNKITQQQLAEKVGVSRQTIISIEKGSYTPSVLLSIKIAKTLSKTVEELFLLKTIMNKHIKKEILVALGMVIISFFCLFSTMTPMVYVGVHILAVVLFILFAFMIWRSKAQDERESMNKAISSDIAFTVGGVMLGIAMIYQIYANGHIDIWIMVTLATMILARVTSQIWLDKNN